MACCADGDHQVYGTGTLTHISAGVPVLVAVKTMGVGAGAMELMSDLVIPASLNLHYS